MRKGVVIVPLVVAAAAGAWWLLRSPTSPIVDHPRTPGTPLDSLNGVVVYDNGSMSAVHGRNTVGGYNVGLKYQCVEFVKRYYLEHYNHRMPDSYGHAKDFFDAEVSDGSMNEARGLVQFNNPSASKPQVGDLLVLDGWSGNAFGHVAIISAVEDGAVEVIQQNTGSTRNDYDLDMVDGRWRIDSERALGWLRMP